MAFPVHPHPATAHGPADTGLALAVAAVLHPPAARVAELVPSVTRQQAKTQAKARAAKQSAKQSAARAKTPAKARATTARRGAHTGRGSVRG
ncbi:hypothetical protein [Streptomyces xanthii]|uniref:Uncharacterized protein n=1 Tax=Streptomyces xanthii TaxID=2768069 RepID=A0A7H1B8I4_9ACTN|nr:hypothetical protein [Streptomyces xanthii]QNS05039.1 hypothetical protein IAG42_16420 [Streptomyces xanthii]